jgi:signal transduction histidine kinase
MWEKRQKTLPFSEEFLNNQQHLLLSCLLRVIRSLRWPSSYRYLKRLGVPATHAEQARVETALGYARFALAVLAIIAVVIDASEPAVYARLVYVLLTVWMLYAAGVIAWLKSQGMTPKFSRVLHVSDIVWPGVITLFTHGPSSPFFALYAFSLIGAAFRWGFAETVATSITGVVLLDFEALYLTGTTKSFHELLIGEFEINRLIIRCAYLIAIGFLVGTLGENAKERRAESIVIGRVLRATRAELGLNQAMRSVFKEYEEIFGAERCYLVSEDLNTERVFVWHGPTREVPDQEPYATEEASARGLLMRALPRVFFAEKAKSGRWWSKTLEGQQATERELQGVPTLPFHNGEVRSLLCCSAELGHDWASRLIVVNCKIGEDADQELRFAERLLGQALPAVYSVYLVRRLRDRVGAMERARVARELHDGAIQSLISAEMRVDVLRRKAQRESPGLLDELVEVQELLRQEVLNLRELMLQMKPLDLGPQQLLDFMAETVDRFRRDSGVGGRFVSDVEEDIDLTPHICSELMKILQESLVNVRKHAKATNVLVTFAASNDSYRLTVADDGQGFDFAGKIVINDPLSTAKGPTIIKERVHGIGGQLAIESYPGHGSRLEIIVPQKGIASYGDQERQSTNSSRG